MTVDKRAIGVADGASFLPICATLGDLIVVITVLAIGSVNEAIAAKRSKTIHLDTLSITDQTTRLAVRAVLGDLVTIIAGFLIEAVHYSIATKGSLTLYILTLCIAHLRGFSP